MWGFFKSLYLNLRFFGLLGGCALLFVIAFAFPWLLGAAKLLLACLGLLLLIDVLLLYTSTGVVARRRTPEKLSNGDPNPIALHIGNRYGFALHAQVIDELPVQLQERRLPLPLRLPANSHGQLAYTVRPTKRGLYQFGALNVMASTPLGLAARRYRLELQAQVPCYPSYIQMRKYELYAISDRLVELGVKRIRKIGQNMEFDQIRHYVQGDDYRSVNWKATARHNQLMVKQFRDERAQQVYSVIDKGRVMKMPFEGLTLLDYAINASLAISNIAIKKMDKAGVVTFGKKVGALLPASSRSGQMSQIADVLYRQKTGFQDSDYEALFAHLRKRIGQRSLILLYTNFETRSALDRQIHYMRSLAQKHLLVVIFFENTELATLLQSKPQSTEEIYLKTIAEKFMHEKRQIVKELGKYGIHAILTTPQQLTVNTINKYLELKARNLI